MGSKIFVIGSSNTDMVVKGTKIPPPGETVIGGEFLMNSGGKGANQAVAAAKLGAEVVFVCKVGNDLFGEKAITDYRNYKICTDFIKTDENHASGIALIMVDEQGRNCISVASGANAYLKAEDLIDVFSEMSVGDFLLLQLEIPLETVYFCIEESAKKGVKVILNPAPATEIDISLLNKIYLFTPNQYEAEAISGIAYAGMESLLEIVTWFHTKGMERIMITLGEKGVFFSDSIQKKLFPAPRVVAKDTTAAGDVFNGALVVALSRNNSMEEAIRFACRAAAISVTKFGAQSSAPSLEEIENFIF